MKAKNVTTDQMYQALAMVNKRYDCNVDFADIAPVGRQVKFTLKVKDSRKPGARRSHSGRRIAKACWHVHGHLFEAILNLAPEAVIISHGGPGARIDRNGGNWKDCNIGSQFQPMMFSEACECNS